MSLEGKKVELLAPAGNPESFYGAINAGADAVYLAGSQFGARAYADNFTTKELVSCIRYAHICGRKVYLTVNTLVKESEIALIPEYLRPFYEAGLDGVIVQDIGVLAVIRENFPGLELHASTQMTVTGEYGATLLKDMGVCRIVPARELSLQEIVAMKEATGLEMETFIHGAMCYSYSGQCLFSSILGGRSGNRGRCAGPCRLPYKVTCAGRTTEECFPLSLKDMCTIEHIPELIGAGIDSFKIEGRMKKPEYAAGVTAIYRKYIDKYYKNVRKYGDKGGLTSAQNKAYKVGHNNGNINGKSNEFCIDPKDLQALSNLYIRSERQDGYYYKTNGADMISLRNPRYSGSDDELLAQVRAKYLKSKPTLPVSVYAVFLTGQPASITMICGEHSVSIEGDVVSAAMKQPITKENIDKQLRKTGETCFSVEDMDITVSEDAFYPLKAINELRRKAVVALEDEIIAGHGLCAKRETMNARRETIDTTVKPDNALDTAVKHINTSVTAVKPTLTNSANHNAKRFSGTTKHFAVSLRTKEQLQELVSWLEIYAKSGQENKIDTVFLAEELFLQHTHLCSKIKEYLGTCSELILSLPYIVRRKDHAELQKLLYALIDGIQVRSMEGLGLLLAEKYTGKIYADAGFYHWNRKTISEWSSKISGFCLPYELKSGEQRGLIEELADASKVYKVIYGRIPMMLTANCVAKTTVGCQKASGERFQEISGDGFSKASGKGCATLTDRYRKEFPVVFDCNHCMNIIYNSVPLSLHGEMDKWRGCAVMRLDFTTEGAGEVSEILDYFMTLEQGRKSAPPYKDYTTGHEKRGVE